MFSKIATKEDVDLERLELRKKLTKKHRDKRIIDVEWRLNRYYSEQRNGITPTDDIALLDAYIQELRDVPNQTGFPDNVVWPIEP